MIDIDKYIIEKLRINKDTKSIHSGSFTPEDEKEIKNKMSDIIKDYLQNNLGLDTMEYITDTSQPKYVSLYYSKGKFNLENIADNLYKLLKPFCIKEPYISGKIIYFYFE